LGRLENTINSLANEMRVHGAIVIWGAGASFEAGLPLYAQLTSIVWQVVDEYPSIKSDLGYDANYSAKAIIGEDINKIKDIFNYIERYSDASQRFKEVFKAVNDRHNTNHSFVHESLCKLIHAGYIKVVISLNWDDLLEKAWERLYGTKINDNRVNLLKPHGDVRDFNIKWIFPNSKGSLSETDLEIVNMVSNNAPSTLIILGYSESDQVIVDQLIKPNEAKYKVFRISPSASESIPLKGSEALKALLEEFPEDNDTVWSYLDFTNQVGMERAIMGYRLLPSDVMACARLPQIVDAKNKLDQTHSVIIKGAPGCGKSITAYQLAFNYQNQGWEVVKFDNSKLISPGIRFKRDGYKTLYILEDAQQIKDDIIIKLIGSANQTLKIIITQTLASEFSAESVTISKEQSVKAIYNHYLVNKNNIISIIKNVNKLAGRNVGDSFMDTPIEYILDLALNEETPWMFNYSLRGGWENTKNQFSIAKEFKRADIVLTLIAFKQIIALDKPVEIDWLLNSAKEFSINSARCDEVLHFLFKEKMILDIVEIRTLHLQAAIRIIINFIDQASIDECNTLYFLMQNELISERTPLHGLLWFFNLLFRFDVKYRLYHNVLTNEYCNKLLNRCLLQTDSESISIALFVIDSVIHRDGGIKYKEILEQYGHTLKSWIEYAKNNTVLALSKMLNNMINEDKDKKRRWVESLNITKIIHQLENVESKYLFDWAEFLDRLSMYQSSKWNKQLYHILPRQGIHSALQQTDHTNIYGLVKMLCILVSLNKEYGYREYHSSLFIIERALNWNFSDTLSDLGLEFLMYFCGEKLFTVGRPNKHQRDAAKNFIKCIKEDMISDCILTGTPRDWERLYRFASQILRYDSPKMNNAIDKVDFKVLDRQALPLMSTQPDELLKLFEIIKIFKPDMISNWIFSRRNDIDFLKVSLIAASPQTAEYLLNHKKQVYLVDKRHKRWGASAEAISKLKSYNKTICRSFIQYNKHTIEESILELSPLDWDDYYKFFSSLTNADAGFMKKLLNELSVEDIEIKWADKVNSPRYPSNRQKESLKGFLKLINKMVNFTENKDLVTVVNYLSVVVTDELQKASE
jgi:hypothetical protein